MKKSARLSGGLKSKQVAVLLVPPRAGGVQPASPVKPFRLAAFGIDVC